MACQIVLADRPLLDPFAAVAGHIDLPVALASVPAARRYVRDFLSDVAEEIARDCELLSSELVTNVIMHARTPVHLGIRHDGRTVLVAVQDFADSDGHPAAPAPIGLAESGRGMEIVARLADDFGWMRLADGRGKLLWFTLSLDPMGGES